VFDREGGVVSYTRTDHERIVAALGQVGAALDDAVAAVAAGDAEAAGREVERARGETEGAIASFPAITMNESTSLPFEQIYRTFYEVDILIIIALQWPDTAPTAITEMKELLDGFTEQLADLRQLRAQPWSSDDDDSLAGLDELIAKTDELQSAMQDLPPRTRLDPRRFEWLGQVFKARFLNGRGSAADLGTMYGFLFSLSHATARAQWSVVNRKMPGASRRLAEAKRVHQLLLDWLGEHQP
jgi:hypothetical protein